jgi:predicted membrane channel-forming protein YqfA (hemolysin III family)
MKENLETPTGLAPMRSPSWWLDHVIGTIIASFLYPLQLFLGAQIFILVGGTALRLVVERRHITGRREALRHSWIMALASIALAALFAVTDDPDTAVTSFLFVSIVWAILPAPLYALVMPLAHDRWMTKYSLRKLPSLLARLTSLFRKESSG